MKKFFNIIMGSSIFVGVALSGCEDLKFGEKFLDKPISNELNRVH